MTTTETITGPTGKSLRTLIHRTSGYVGVVHHEWATQHHAVSWTGTALGVFATREAAQAAIEQHAARYHR